MWGRAMAAAYVLAASLAHEWAEPARWPGPAVAAGGALAGLLAFRRAGRGGVWAVLRGLLGCGLAACLALGWSGWRIEARLADRLDPANEDKVARVELRVQSLPRRSAEGVSFEGLVESARPEGVPRRVLVFWPSARGRRGGEGGAQGGAWEPAPPDVPDVRPGQRWRMALNLRSPWSARNRWQRDGEALLFERGVRARATVRGRPQALEPAPWADLETVANGLRYRLRAAMQAQLQGRRYGGVLLALAIGDQDSVEDADWQVFRRSGIIHLVSISGSHITMVAALGGVLAGWLWPRLRWRGRWLAERVPVRLAAAGAALAVAWVYCLLAGWGVPARRTFFMLLVLAGAWAWRLPLSGSQVLALAAVLVSALDPWAPRAAGFWLSFGAVAVLMALAARSGGRPAREPPPALAPAAMPADTPVAAPGLAPAPPAEPPRRALVGPALALAVKAQLAVSAALLPPLAWLFHEVSLVSPLANAYAIALIGWVVTPLSLLLAVLSLPEAAAPAAALAAGAAHAVLSGLMAPTAWLASLPAAALPVAAAPTACYLLALAGVGLGLRARRPLVRRWAWLLLLPMMLWRPPAPPLGDWDLHVLDVGQAGAALLRTHTHAVLFDTGQGGARGDDGERVVAPLLRALGLRRLDGLVVSHADLDHAGGLRGVLAAVPVRQSYASFPLEALLARRAPDGAMPPLPASMASCRRGLQWVLDEVHFEFLWPADEATGAPGAGPSGDRNARSCVLRVAGRHHSLLFTGDIGQAQERQLARLGLPATQAVLVPHHGSRGSSSAALVGALAAEHAVAQAGPWNRHGHPHPLVQERWRAAGAAFWRTDHHGGLSLSSRAGGLAVRSERLASPRPWSAPMAARP